MEFFSPLELLYTSETMMEPDPSFPHLCVNREGIIIDNEEIIGDLEGCINTDIDTATGMVTWSYKRDSRDDAFIRSSYSETPISHVRTMRGSFVSEIFGADTDIALGKMFPNLVLDCEEEAVLTPDFILQSESGNYIVLEVSSCRSQNESILHKKYREKIGKYHYPLTKCKGKIWFVVVIISPTSVISSIPLPNDLVYELCFRMNVMLCIEDELLGRGMNVKLLDAEDVESSYSTMIDEIFYNTEVKEEEGGLIMGSNYMKKIRNESSDKKKVWKYFVESMNQEKLMNNKEERKFDHTHYGKINKNVKTYLDSQNGRETKMKQKSICILPLMVGSLDVEGTIEVENIPTTFGKSPLGSIWEKAVSRRFYEESGNYESMSNEELYQESMKEAHFVSPEEEDIKRKRRQKFHRINLKDDLTKEEIHILAMDGVWGKCMRDEASIVLKHKESQIPLSLEIDTMYIKQFLKSGSLMEFCGRDNTETPEMELLAEAYTSLDSMEGRPTGDTWETLETVMTTSFYRSMDIISDIMMEISLNIKHNCKPGQLILTKCKRYKILIMINPTKSSEHIFFSLCFYGDMAPLDTSNVFRTPIQFEEGWLTDFVSVRADRLENLVSAPNMFISLVSYWSWHLKIDMNDERFLDNMNLQENVVYQMLVRLEDRAETEETISLTRYMYMELMKEERFNCRVGNPFKMMEKFNSKPRSHLNVYSIQQIIKTFLMMDITKPRRYLTRSLEDDNQLNSEEKRKDLDDDDKLEDIEKPEDHWIGLLSYIDQQPISDSSRLVNLFYVGYAHSKNHKPQGNVEFQILEKALAEEFKYNPKEEDKSNGTFDEYTIEDPPKAKQFSRSAIIYGSDLLGNQLRKTYGRDYKLIMKNKILTKLSSITSDVIATLKASSSVLHKKTEDQPTMMDDSEDLFRIKVLEAMARDLDMMGTNPFLSLNKIIEQIEETAWGIIADLFKKNQHTGLREIYVLTLRSRIIQLFLETCSRVLCSEFEEEALTHPGNKMKIVESHVVSAAKYAHKHNMSYVTLNNSSDKKRWNQNLVMPAMIIPLIRLLPDDMHPVILRSLNLWTKKLIRMPDAVCDMLQSGVVLESPTYKELQDKFLEINKVGYPTNNTRIFPKKGSRVVTLQTGMMQGILHYTSSLLHLTLLRSSTVFIKDLVHGLCPKAIVMVSQECSSDDSAAMVTIFVERHEETPDIVEKMKENDRVAFSVVEKILCCLPHFAKYFCMDESLKSTLGVHNVVEFNSEFFFRNTLSVPSMKFVLASLSVTESESMVDRFHQLYNLLSDIYAAGMPSHNTSIMQLSQGLLHYKIMGSSVNPLFSIYSRKLLEYKDPAFGFFCLDSKLICGLMGYSFSKWYNAKLNGLIELKQRDFVSNQKDGSITSSLVIRHGGLQKWHRLVSAVSGLQYNSARDLVNENPDIMYLKPETRDDVLLSMIAKSLSPGVAKSLAIGDPFLQAISMSVYSINTHCFTKSTFEIVEGKRIKVISKVSLMREISDKISDKAISNETNESFENSQMLMYPNYKRYEATEATLSLFINSVERQAHRSKSRKSNIIIHSLSSLVPITLLDICTFKWYQKRIGFAKVVIKRCWNQYKMSIPWLRDTLEETLEESPFEDHIELHNFISTGEKKNRVITRVGPAIRSMTLQGQIKKLVQRSAKEGSFLSIMGVVKGGNLKTSESDLKSKLALSLMIPNKLMREKRTLSLLRNHVSQYTLDEINHLVKRDAKLAYICQFASKMSSQDILHAIQASNYGLDVIYLKEQEQRESDEGIKWAGAGEMCMSLKEFGIWISLKDDFVTSIRTNDLKKFNDFKSEVANMIKELRLSMMKWKVQQGKMGFSGLSVLYGTGMGVPLDIVNFVPGRHTNLSHELFIGRGSLKLKVRLGGKTYTKIDYYSKSYDINLIPNHREVSDPWEAWIGQSSLQGRKAYRLLQTSQEGYNMEMREWVRTTLGRRLASLGLFRTHSMYNDTIPQSIDTDVKGHIDIVDFQRESFDMKFLHGTILSKEEPERRTIEENDQEAHHHDESDSSYDWNDDSSSDDCEYKKVGEFDFLVDGTLTFEDVAYNLFSDQNPLSEEFINYSMSAHLAALPFWDLMIRGLEKGELNFWKVLEDGLGSSLRRDDASRLVCSCFGIKYLGVRPDEIADWSNKDHSDEEYEELEEDL